MQVRRRRRKPMSDMNVVPYIDVMLVLLIIFMVTAPMLTTGIDINLPRVDAEQIEVDENNLPLVISISADGGYYIEENGDTQEVALPDLKTAIADMISLTPNRAILVRGDDRVDYGTVVAMIRIVQEQGATRVGLMTDQE